MSQIEFHLNVRFCGGTNVQSINSDMGVVRHDEVYILLRLEINRLYPNRDFEPFFCVSGWKGLRITTNQQIYRACLEARQNGIGHLEIYLDRHDYGIATTRKNLEDALRNMETRQTQTPDDKEVRDNKNCAGSKCLEELRKNLEELQDKVEITEKSQNICNNRLSLLAEGEIPIITSDVIGLEKRVSQFGTEIADLKIQMNLLQLKKGDELPTVGQTPKNDKRKKFEHAATCDVCDKSISGHRFKCLICPDYDLCAQCESEGLHENHALMRIVNPNITVVPGRLRKFSNRGCRVNKLKDLTGNFLRQCELERLASFEAQKAEKPKTDSTTAKTNEAMPTAAEGSSSISGISNSLWGTYDNMMNKFNSLSLGMDPMYPSSDMFHVFPPIHPPFTSSAPYPPGPFPPVPSFVPPPQFGAVPPYADLPSFNEPQWPTMWNNSTAQRVNVAPMQKTDVKQAEKSQRSGESTINCGSESGSSSKQGYKNNLNSPFLIDVLKHSADLMKHELAHFKDTFKMANVSHVAPQVPPQAAPQVQTQAAPEVPPQVAPQASPQATPQTTPQDSITPTSSPAEPIIENKTSLPQASTPQATAPSNDIYPYLGFETILNSMTGRDGQTMPKHTLASNPYKSAMEKIVQQQTEEQKKLMQALLEANRKRDKATLEETTSVVSNILSSLEKSRLSPSRSSNDSLSSSFENLSECDESASAEREETVHNEVVENVIEPEEVRAINEDADTVEGGWTITTVAGQETEQNEVEAIDTSFPTTPEPQSVEESDADGIHTACPPTPIPSNAAEDKDDGLHTACPPTPEPQTLTVPDKDKAKADETAGTLLDMGFSFIQIVKVFTEVGYEKEACINALLRIQ